MKKSKQCWIVLVAAVILAVVLYEYLPVHGEEEIYDSVIRLHVLANSDGEEDQQLKLKVRDTVLAFTQEQLQGAETRDEAREVLQRQLDEIAAQATETIRAEGYPYSVRVTLGEEDYPTRNYESFCFPSGRYLSLRVMIGEASGKNWWCVLFPPLCLSAASAGKQKAEEEFVSVGLTKDQYGVITETKNSKYRLRFKCMEAWEKLRSAFER